METSSFAAWLSDSSIDLPERKKRVLQFRFGALVEQKKCAESDASKTEIQRRIDSLGVECSTNGIEVKTNNLGSVTGLKPAKPGATQMIENELGMATTYRVLSAVAHGQPWALQQLCHTEVDPSAYGRTKDRPALSSHMEPVSVAFLAVTCAKATATAFWSYSKFMGWPELAIRNMIGEVFASMGCVPPTLE